MAIEIGKFNVNDLGRNDYKSLGIGINRVSDTNGIFPLNYTTITQAKDNLKNLILTKKGERVMTPDFGCDLWKVIFEPYSAELDQKIESVIVNAAEVWLPYLNIDYINIESDDEMKDQNKVMIQIAFSLKSNSNINDSIEITVE